MVIVIGATGFIGMYTVDRFLEEGYEVLATGRNAIMKQELEAKGVTCVSLDISKKEDFDKLPTEGVEGVILLAGLLPANAPVDISADENAADYIRINVEGTINVLEESDFHQQLCRCKKCMEKRCCLKRDRAERFHVYRRPCGICDFQKCSQ